MTQPNASGDAPIRVLIVDDHPTTATTLARAVAQLGPKVEVFSAASGREALERAHGRAADILITDMIMPEMNGLELAEKLQNHPGGKPAYIILTTAYDVPGLKESSARAKVDQIIIKPVRPEQICQIVEELVTKWERARPAVQEISAAKPFKILIADDHPDNITLLSRYLEVEGYEYVAARDGEEALEQTRRHAPDLILLDLNMPKKTGFAVLEEIRADPALQRLPVIILTAARLDPVDIQSGLNLGADDYVTKPFDRRELMARIRTKLRVKGAEDRLIRQNRELSMVLEITGLLNARGQLADTLNAALELLAQRTGAGAGYIFNFQNGALFSFPRTPGLVNAPALKESLNKTYRSNTAQLIDNARQGEWSDILGAAAASAIIVPMTNRRGGLLGALLLTHPASSYFQPEQMPILQAIAGQVAVVCENAAWYESIQDRKTQPLNSAAL
ncbi:MAG: Sensor histidine kinase RcsC [Anaerolineales bacterium]|nr:Sensor histidine kinase RcsC [Anaerolineales bacterium]